MDDLIDTAEMFLKSILEMEEEGVVAMRVRIAERLEQAGPTVSQTVSRMERDGLLELTPDRHLLLTERGRRRATAVMRKHRLVECLLADVVGLDWEEIHDEACRWEHVMSDRVEDRVAVLLGEPLRSPYGNPIPAARGEGPRFAQPVDSLLRHVDAHPDSADAVVAWIGEPLQVDHDLLFLLRTSGLVPGAVVRAVDTGSFIRLEVDGHDDPIELGPETAAHIFVAHDPNGRVGRN